MKRPLSKPRAVYSTSYLPQPKPNNLEATYGHYEPSRARVQFLVDHALTWGLNNFWERLALRYATTRPPFSAWNEALYIAQTSSSDPGKMTLNFIRNVLYQGEIGRASVRLPMWDQVGRFSSLKPQGGVELATWGCDAKSESHRKSQKLSSGILNVAVVGH